MKRIQSPVTVVIAVLFLLAACGSSGAETTVEPQAQPAATATEVPEPTATTAPTLVPTVEPEPTATTEPTATAVPEPTATTEPTATAEPAESAEEGDDDVSGEGEPSGETGSDTDDHADHDHGAETDADDDPLPVDDADPAIIEVGAAVYQQSCSNCHAGDGSGTSRGQALIGVGQFFVEDASPIVNLVTNGGTNMPAFGTRLTADEIEAVVQFVVTTFP